MSDVVTSDSRQLKDLIKAALVELWEEKRGDLQEMLAEVIEDAWLIDRIDEGMRTEEV